MLFKPDPLIYHELLLKKGEIKKLKKSLETLYKKDLDNERHVPILFSFLGQGSIDLVQHILNIGG